jgi:CheY-like chemotaxis protein
LAWAQESAQNSSTEKKPAANRPLSDIEKLLGRPPSIELLWQVIERDLAYGVVDEAAKHLQDLLGREDLSGEKLLDLREKFGAGLIIKLQRHPELAEQAKPLLEMLTKASQARASDAKRIQYFISKLDDSASERDYAIEQLNRSGPLAVPYYIEAIREKSVHPDSLLKGLLALPHSAWEPVAAALESDIESLQSLMLDVLVTLGEPRAAESMQVIAGSSDYSAPLRDKARQAISLVEKKPVDRLGSPVARLVEIARKYDEHDSGLGDPTDPFTLWQWQDDNVVATPMTVSDAEEYLGLRAAQQALRLDPQNNSAKVVFLKLALETSTLRGGIDRPLPLVAEGSLETSVAAGPELLLSALQESIHEHRPALALSAVRALGDVASPATVAGDPERPSPLVQALDFPNSRVRFEAATTALSIHANQSFSQADRVVATLAQAIDPSQNPTAMVMDDDLARGQNVGSLLQQLGYDSAAAVTGTDGYAQAKKSGLIELFVIDSEIREPGLLDVISTLEKDGRTAGIPVVVIAREPLGDFLSDRLKLFSHVAVLPPIADPAKWAEALAMELPDRALAPWTPEERQSRRSIALDWLVRLARGELPYVDVQPAIEPLTRILNDEELASRAAEALSYLPNAQAQKSLAAVALDSSLPASTRSASARGLARNMARGTNALPQADIEQFAKSLDGETDPELRRGLAAVVGVIDRRGTTAADRMKRYRPGSLEPKSLIKDEEIAEPLPPAEK